MSAIENINTNTPDYLIDRWLWRPDVFSEDVFGVTLWDGQLQVCDEMKINDRVSVKSGHKTGKSKLIAILAYWWAVTRPGGRSPLTSSSFFQVRKILWREITMLYRSARVDLGCEWHEDPRTGVKFPATGSEIFGFSTRDKERAAGISSPFNFYQVDEASGKQYDDLDDAVEGNLAGGGKKILYSQATRVSGVFYDSFRNPRSPYAKITLNSEDSPNVKARKIIIPGLATYEWVKEREEQWGRDSTSYSVRVLGEFPRQSDEAIITYDMLHRAQVQWEARSIGNNLDYLDEMRIVRVETGPMFIGVDVAYFGNDEAVLFPRRGLVAMKPKAFRKKDGPELAGEILDFCQKVKESGYLRKDKIVVNVDCIGVGTSCYDSLMRSERRRLMEILVVPIDNQRHATPEDDETYADFMTELRFALARWLNAGGCLPEDHLLEQELLLPEYDYDEKLRKYTSWKDEKGHIHRLNKKLFKRLIGRSPDRSDGLLLSMFENNMRNFTYTSDGYGKVSTASKLPGYVGNSEREESVFAQETRGFLSAGRGSLKNFTR